MKPDYTLYLVTDRALMSARTLDEAVEQAVLGGCTMVQIRERAATDQEFYKRALEIRRVTDRYQVPLIVNNRADIACAVGAAGVHIGQRDLPAAAVRKMIGHGMLLGVSASCLEEAERARGDGADYLGVGAMFPTNTKTDAGLVTLEELRRIRRTVRLPMVVIGGVGPENAALFRREGVEGLAVVSAVISQPDIRRAAAELRAAFEGTAPGGEPA